MLTLPRSRSAIRTGPVATGTRSAAYLFGEGACTMFFTVTLLDLLTASHSVQRC